MRTITCLLASVFLTLVSLCHHVCGCMKGPCLQKSPAYNHLRVSPQQSSCCCCRDARVLILGPEALHKAQMCAVNFECWDSFLFVHRPGLLVGNSFVWICQDIHPGSSIID